MPQHICVPIGLIICRNRRSHISCYPRCLRRVKSVISVQLQLQLSQGTDGTDTVQAISTDCSVTHFNLGGGAYGFQLILSIFWRHLHFFFLDQIANLSHMKRQRVNEVYHMDKSQHRV